MKINRISIYRKALTYVGGSYAWGRGNVIEVGKSTIVTIETDSGLSVVAEDTMKSVRRPQLNNLLVECVAVEPASKIWRKRL